MNLLNIDFKQPNIQIPSNLNAPKSAVDSQNAQSQPIAANSISDSFSKVPMNLYYDLKDEATNIKNDILHLVPISTDGLKRPDAPPKSRLVNDSIVMAPFNFVRDIAENVVNIKDALQGKSNDHDLGRINDFAMKAGALGLAGYLFTRAKAPTSKAMEFIGFGSFFASMALWPKLFIEMPVKLMYGRNFNQKYIDNNGRKKRFSQDPQYKPWDLYTDEQLSKLGDRLGVPKGIHNRNEIIKAKANKIDLQANTLWMMTAGFATPLMSALICNRAEKYVTPYLEKVRVQRALENAKKETSVQNIIKNADSTFEVKEAYSREIDDIFRDPSKTVLSKKELERLVEVMTHNNDVFGEEALRAQLEAILPKVDDVVDKSFVDYVYAAVKQNNELAAHDSKFTAINVLPANRAEIESLLDGEIDLKTFQNKLKYLFTTEKGTPLSKKDEKLLNMLIQKAKVMYNNQNLDMKIEEIVDVKTAMRKAPAYRIAKGSIGKIQQLDKILIGFSREFKALDAYKHVLLNSEAESVAANRWNQTTKAFFEVLGINEKELLRAKDEGSEVSKIVAQKLEALARDEKAYSDAFTKVRDAILEFDKTFLPDAGGMSQGAVEDLKARYGVVFEKYAEVLNEKEGFGIIANRILGGEEFCGSVKSTLYRDLDGRLFELRTGMYKMLHVMDVFRRIESGDVASKFRELSNGNYDESFINKLKSIILDATISDHTTKFNMENTSQREYNAIMKLLYSEDINATTKRLVSDIELGNTNFAKSFKDYIHEALMQLGSFTNPHNQRVRIDGAADMAHANYATRDMLCGPKISNIVRDAASQVYNSGKWLSRYGGMFAALVGITILSETFFGKMSKEDIFVSKKG